jgi:hypothetical protein
MELTRLLAVTALATLGLAGCSGDDGKDGTDGTDGTAGPPGAPGIACWDLNQNGLPDANEDINGDGVVDVADCYGGMPLEPVGIVGRVSDASGAAVTNGVVYFVPTADVATLPATTVEVDSINDEPLEDAIAANGAGYQQATVGANGTYALETLAAGSYFVTFMPGAADSGHLPGGSECRSALASDDLIGQRLDIVVSSAVPEDATFVGSGPCVSCHGKTHIGQTMHRIGIWSGYESGPLQDFGPRFDELYQGIEDKFEAAGGTTIYYYDFDPTRGFDKYKTSESDPGANVAFTVRVFRDGEDLKMELQNIQNPADPNREYRVDFIYGGGVKKQRYVTRLENEFGPFNVMLPVQFQHDGVESPVYGRTSKVWRDYHGQKWYDETTDTFKEPLPKDSFEKNCGSCHAVGARIAGSDDTTWRLETVEDRIFNSGDFDFDGNGIADEMNVGCESCHGPGSRHWESAGLGKHIVSPQNLTPEREAVICGQCHSRPKGAFGTDNPVNSQGLMMVAGTSRNDFLANYATAQLDGAASDYYGDPDGHSKSHHQQYSDFIRSAMYKNDSTLMTCSSCHDPHQRTANARQVIADPTDNFASCGSCHGEQTGEGAFDATALNAHLEGKGIPGGMYKAENALCTDCHMVKTAKTGAGHPARVIDGVQYWANDITSHLFKMPRKELAGTLAMPVAYTNECAICHVAAP